MESCACGEPGALAVASDHGTFGAQKAALNRRLFAEQSVLSINLMGLPGAGKTALLEATARAFLGTRRIGAFTPDAATRHDAERLRAAGVLPYSLPTGSSCFLDAYIVHKGLHDTDWHGLDFLFVENTGKLACPVMYDVGANLNVAVIAATDEADDPQRYPLMFRKADIVVLTKVDLLAPGGAHLQALTKPLEPLMEKPFFLPVSTLHPQGLDRWLAWLEDRSPSTIRA